MKRFEDFEGSDVNLETAIFEYGFAWKENEDKSVTFLYGIGFDGEVFNAFQTATLTKEDWEDIIEESWFSVPELESFSGSLLEFPLGVEDAVRYFGSENIFGSSYSDPLIILEGGE